MSWYYKQTEKFPPLYTVGYGEDKNGRFIQTDSDHSTQEAAAERIHYLNGGTALTALTGLQDAFEVIAKAKGRS